MKIESTLSDTGVLQALGERLKAQRVQLKRTQAQLARQAGISKRTLERIEAGDPSQTVNLVRVLRELGLLEGLDQLVPDLGPTPLEVVKGQAAKPKRVMPARDADLPDADEPSNWRWR